MEYVLLSELSLQRQNCKIKVRICRIWESTAPFLNGDIFSLDCLLVDEKGYSLQGMIRKQDAEEVRCRLTEGSVYLIEKFSVIPTKKRYAAVERLYMLQINKWTSLTLLEENTEDIPLYSFTFLTFSQLEKQKYNDAVLADVFGQIIAVGDITQKYVGQTLATIRNLEIQDLENNILPITLWDKFALDFDDNYISEKNKNVPIIIILAGMTVRSFREKMHLSTCSASKIYFDLEIPEVSDLLNSLQPTANLIQRIDTSHDQLISPQEEMCSNRKTVAELLALDISAMQNVKVTCQAKVVDIDTTFGWWYKACRNCKAAVRTYDDTFRCSSCNENDQPPIPWYKLNIIVDDGSGTANFVVFGKIAQELIRIPAQNLAILPGSDQYSLPPAIKTVIGQMHIFQIVPDAVRFTSGFPSFKVIKIFTLYSNIKGKSPAATNLLIKCEEHVHSPETDKQIQKEIFVEPSPNTECSSGSGQLHSDLSEIQHAKRLRLTFDEGASTDETNK